MRGSLGVVSSRAYRHFFSYSLPPSRTAFGGENEDEPEMSKNEKLGGARQESGQHCVRKRGAGERN